MKKIWIIKRGYQVDVSAIFDNKHEADSALEHLMNPMQVNTYDRSQLHLVEHYLLEKGDYDDLRTKGLLRITFEYRRVTSSEGPSVTVRESPFSSYSVSLGNLVDYIESTVVFTSLPDGFTVVVPLVDRENATERARSIWAAHPDNKKTMGAYAAWLGVQKTEDRAKYNFSIFLKKMKEERLAAEAKDALEAKALTNAIADAVAETAGVS